MNAIAHASAVPASGPQLDNRRIAAALIDLAIVVGGAFVIGLAAGLSGVGEGGAGLTAVVLAWALYYYFACESSGGQTLGKKAMKLRVVRMDGGTAGMGDIGVRTILRLIDGLFLYLVGLVVMLATGKRRGRLGDLAARTKIVSADAAALPASPVPVAAPTVTQTLSLPSYGPAPVTVPVAPAPGPESLAAPEMRPFDPVAPPAVELAPEPVVEVAPEPVVEVVEVAPEPVVEVVEAAQEPVVEADPEPVVEAYPDPVVKVMPAFAFEPEPVVEVAPAFALEPVTEAEPAVEPEPVVEVRAVPLFGAVEPVDEPVSSSAPEPEPEEEDEPQVVVRSFETVSAIDLIMAEDEPDEDPPGEDSRPASI
ncbi:MAG: RDD family protein [Thermoleophilaceae bacterium]